MNGIKDEITFKGSKVVYMYRSPSLNPRINLSPFFTSHHERKAARTKTEKGVKLLLLKATAIFLFLCILLH